MKKRKILTLVIVVALVGGLMVACAKPAPAPAPAPVPAPTPKPAPAPAPTPTPAPAPSGETAEDILARAATIKSAKYDIIITAPGQPVMTTKVWVKGQNMRTEMTQQGQTGVYILNMDKGVAYMYVPAQNMATKIPLPTGAQPRQSFAQVSPMALAAGLASSKPTVVGTESIDGKESLVMESTSAGQTTKVWVWKKYGFPVRIEAASPQGTMILEYKNIDFANIPDSMFELPAGVKIQ